VPRRATVVENVAIINIMHTAPEKFMIALMMFTEKNFSHVVLFFYFFVCFCSPDYFFFHF